MNGLSILQLCLITAMKRLREQEVHTTNFEQVYKEFSDFASLHLKQMLVEKAVCLKVRRKASHLVSKAFEQLLELEIIKAVETTKNHREFQRVKLMLLNGQVVDGLQQYADCPTNLVKWGTKWIE